MAKASSDDRTPSGRRNRHAFATRAVHGVGEADPGFGAVSVPIYATSTFAQESPGVHKGHDCARSRNPTRGALERCLADLENGSAAFSSASGSAATAAVLECLDAGAHIIATDDLYGGSLRLSDLIAGLDQALAQIAP